MIILFKAQFLAVVFLLCTFVWCKDYNDIDAVTAASNKNKGKFVIEGGKAYSDHAELYIMFADHVKEGSRKGYLFLKYGKDEKFSDDSLNMAPIEKEELTTKTLSGLTSGTTYYYWIYGEHEEDGEKDWLEVKSSFETFKPEQTAVIQAKHQQFRFTAPGSSHLFSTPAKAVNIHDISGKLVTEVPVVQNSAIWNGTDGAGRPVNPGIYMAKLITDGRGAIVRFVITE